MAAPETISTSSEYSDKSIVVSGAAVVSALEMRTYGLRVDLFDDNAWMGRHSDGLEVVNGLTWDRFANACIFNNVNAQPQNQIT
jgi:hypothetical protein